MTILFPYPGGKSRVAGMVWRRFGYVDAFADPFCGSSSILLSPERRVHCASALINDIDVFIVNFFRSVARFPRLVARWADTPVNEVDMIARSRWLIRNNRLLDMIPSSQVYCNPKAAGWWAWCMCAMIGQRMTRRELVSHALPYVSSFARGLNKMNYDKRVNELRNVSEQLTGVKITCADWMNAVNSVMICVHGITAIFFDPPYEMSARNSRIYNSDSAYGAAGLWSRVCAWCREHGNDMNLRIALCGYDGTWDPPDGWTTYKWAARSASFGAPGNNAVNRKLERIWFSPGCLPISSQKLLGG